MPQSPPKEGILRIFRTPEKSKGFCRGLNPRTRFPVASMLTTRPPKPSILGFVNGVWEVKMSHSIECLDYEMGDPELDSWQE